MGCQRLFYVFCLLMVLYYYEMRDRFPVSSMAIDGEIKWWNGVVTLEKEKMRLGVVW